MGYSTAVLTRFMQPQFSGELKGLDNEYVFVAHTGDYVQGAVLQLAIAVNAATHQIERARFKLYGCGACIALADMACEHLQGLNYEQALQFKAQDIATELELPMVKMHCAWLFTDAWTHIMASWQNVISH